MQPTCELHIAMFSRVVIRRVQVGKDDPIVNVSFLQKIYLHHTDGTIAIIQQVNRYRRDMTINREEENERGEWNAVFFKGCT